MVRVGPRYFLFPLWVAVLLVLQGLAQAQDDKANKPGDQSADATATSSSAPAQATDQADPLKRPPTEKQKKRNERALKQELSKSYKKWLDEDVVWIITPEERSAFMQLSNDEERDNFIEAFWQRRDPTPDTEENE